MIEIKQFARVMGLALAFVGCADIGTVADEQPSHGEPQAQSSDQALVGSTGVIDDLLGSACGTFLAGQEASLHSCCGQPGDRGNELGVGKFCFTDGQCKRNKEAKYCSSAENAEGDHKSYFCSMPCDPAAENTCGNGAACTCEESGACGCAPVACIESPAEGCDEV